MQRRLTIIHAVSLAILGLLVLAACSPRVVLPATYSVAVEVDGAGSGSVTSSPEGIDVSSGDAPASAEFDEGTVVTLTAVAAGGSTFAGWSGDCSGTEPCVITLDDDVSVTATFDLEQYTLSVSAAGGGTGNVTSDPSGIDLDAGVDTLTLDFGSAITLIADPDPDNAFVGWSGDCTGTDPCVITIDGDADVTATFESEFTLTVTTSGRAGNVTSSPAGIDLDAGFSTLTVVDGDTVTLTAEPALGNAFFGWTSGGCTGTDPCTLIVTADLTVNAEFFDPVLDVTTATVRVGASADDAHEYAQFVNDDYPAGSVHTDSSRIGLGWDGTRGVVVTGLRFVGVDIPQGALITEATVTFSPLGGAANNLGSPTFDVRGEASDAAGTFVYDPVSPANFDITSRPTTSSVVNWVPGAWDAATATTNDLASVVQELVDREGWGVASPVVFIISSTDSDQDNRRRAFAWDSNPDLAPLFTVRYYTPTTP